MPGYDRCVDMAAVKADEVRQVSTGVGGNITGAGSQHQPGVFGAPGLKLFNVRLTFLTPQKLKIINNYIIKFFGMIIYSIYKEAHTQRKIKQYKTIFTVIIIIIIEKKVDL